VTAEALGCGLLLALAVLPWGSGARAARLRSVRTAPAAPVAAARTDAGSVDVAVLLALLDAALDSGAGVPRALAAVGRAVGGDDGRALERASAALVLGAGWTTAWTGASARLRPVAACLAPTWTTGSAPGPALRAAATGLLRERRTVAREAAGRLGVQLVLPLGLCFLPAFVLIGLVPVLVSVGSQVVR
jgi:pilus assembly protein TadC